MRFYLGTHKPGWLERTEVPLFVSRRRLAEYKTVPRALGPWALDSGAFTELQQHGEWTVPARQYAREVGRWRDEVGNLQWAAPQDWMCEEIVIRGGTVGKMVFKGTGLSVTGHQRLTTENYRELLQIAPDLPWVPVLQGQSEADYLRHADAYDLAGISLVSLPLVGLGSVCRRNNTDTAEYVIRRLHGDGIRLHAFGFKLAGLRRCGRYLASADSLAWSRTARGEAPLPGCKHRRCNNCLRYALWWRQKAIRAIRGSESAEQMMLWHQRDAGREGE